MAFELTLWDTITGHDLSSRTVKACFDYDNRPPKPILRIPRAIYNAFQESWPPSDSLNVIW